MPLIADYVKTDWVEGVTLVNEARMDHIETGVDAATDGVNSLDTRLAAEEAQPDIPAVVNGQWVKGSGGAMVWSPIAIADVTGLQTALDAKQSTTEKNVAFGYPTLDAQTKLALSRMPLQGVRVEQSAAGVQTIPSVTWTALIFNIEIRDDLAMFSPAAPTKLVAPYDGWYSVSCGVELTSSATGSARYCALYSNGAPSAGGALRFAAQSGIPHASNAARIMLATTVYLTATQYVETYVYHDAGGAGLNVNNPTAEYRDTHLAAVRIG